MHPARLQLVMIALGASITLGSCGPDSSRRGTGAPPATDEDLAMGPTGDLAGTVPEHDWDSGIDPGPGPDDNCHEEKFLPKKVGDPDILLIQDISGSMLEGMPTKYAQASGAVSSVLTQLEKAMSPIQWGLLFFPSDGMCGVKNAPDVPIGPQKAAPIVAALKATKPNGNTPLAAAITSGTAYYDQLKDGRGHYFLAATDGEPNCDNGGGLPKTCMKNADCPPGEVCTLLGPLGFCTPMGVNSGATKAITAARLKGIKTFVVGIDLGGTSATLNAMAEAGGTARPGATKYYPVTDQAQLEAALKNITSQIISCTFSLQGLPQINQMVIVTINGQKISQDKTHTDGWDIDPMTKTLTLYGKSCASLQANPGQVSVAYTCPPPG